MQRVVGFLLVIKVLNIIDARCNHEAEFSVVFNWVKWKISEKCLYLKRISTCYTTNI